MSRNLPVPYAGAAQQERVQPRARRAPTEAGYAAQLLGQDGQRRGLKGGQPVLQAARGAYLETEFSGSGDRRPPTGLLRRTAV